MPSPSFDLTQPRVTRPSRPPRCETCGGAGYLLPNGRCRCGAGGPQDCDCLTDCEACDSTGRGPDPDACRETVGCECTACFAEMASDDVAERSAS